MTPESRFGAFLELRVSLPSCPVGWFVFFGKGVPIASKSTNQKQDAFFSPMLTGYLRLGPDCRFTGDVSLKLRHVSLPEFRLKAF